MAIAIAALGTQPDFEFEAGPYPAGDLRVLSFEAEEELSRPFSLTLTLAPPDEVEVDLAALMGSPACLSMQLGDGSSRYIHGVVVGLQSWEEGTEEDRRRLRAEVAPAFGNLRHVRRSRVFQDLSVPKIVEKVLSDSPVEHRASLSATYEPREFCLQYNESDLDFIQRLLEEEGIFYFFEHEKDRHVLVLGDSAGAFPSLPDGEPISYREPGGWFPSGLERIDAFSSRMEVRQGKVTLRDFDFARPAFDLTAAVTASKAQDLEIYEYPGDYLAPSAGKALAKIRLEAERIGSAVSAGSGISRRLLPGYVFELQEHPVQHLDGRYLLVGVHHRGEQHEAPIHGATDAAEEKGERYRNDFVCIHADLPYRPERRTPRPIIAGPQTAIVVGPAGEEIYCDAHGRVKAHFHWDREGSADEHASCWMRVSQAWAGPGFGALYLPRIGQEVVVEFLEGNPDRPIISASLYNGDHPVPVSLPHEKTRSTLRSSSSPGGDGNNELRFEDAAGQEEIFVHAQRDLRVEIENDRTEEVKRDERLTIEKNRACEVGGDRSLDVDHDASLTVSEDQLLKVTKDRSVTVDGDHVESVSCDQSIAVGDSLSISVGGSDTEGVALEKTTDVQKNYKLEVGGASSELVGGLRAETAGGDRKETVGGKKSVEIAKMRTVTVGDDLSESVGKERTLKIGKDLTVGVIGKLTQTTQKSHTLKGKEIVLVASDSFTAKVGSAKIELKKSGEITVKGAKVEMTSGGDLILKANKVTEN